MTIRRNADDLADEKVMSASESVVSSIASSENMVPDVKKNKLGFKTAKSSKSSVKSDTSELDNYDSKNSLHHTPYGEIQVCNK